MNDEMKDFMESLASDVKGIKQIVTETNEKIDKANERSEAIKKEVAELKAENQLLKQRLNDIEQYSRKFDVIINGIPKDEREDLYETIK